MGNIPAKITGKYQSYDINTPGHLTPSMPVRKHDEIEHNVKMDYTREENRLAASVDRNVYPIEQNVDLYYGEKQKGFQSTFNDADSNDSNRNSVYNEHPVDVSSDYRTENSESGKF